MVHIHVYMCTIQVHIHIIIQTQYLLVIFYSVAAKCKDCGFARIKSGSFTDEQQRYNVNYYDNIISVIILL